MFIGVFDSYKTSSSHSSKHYNLLKSKPNPDRSQTPDAAGNLPVTMKLGDVSSGSDELFLFEQCGMITRKSTPALYKSGGIIKGDAFIYFEDRSAVIKALQLSGSNVGGSTITVVEAKQPKQVLESSDASSSKEELAAKKDSSSEVESEESEEEVDVEMVDAPPAKSPQASPGSKTLYMGSLSSQIQEADIISFFKSAGEVVQVHLVMRDDQFQGYGFVKFATPEAALEAFKLDKTPLLDCPVKLDIVDERGEFPPGSKG